MILLVKTFALSSLIVRSSASSCIGPNNSTAAPCVPGHEFCGVPYANAPVFHLMDQHGCAENDPNGPVFDPVHGVFHHFYQIVSSSNTAALRATPRLLARRCDLAAF